MHLCTPELLKYHLKGRCAFWREQEVLLNGVLLSCWLCWCVFLLAVGTLLMQHAGIAKPGNVFTGGQDPDKNEDQQWLSFLLAGHFSLL